MIDNTNLKNDMTNPLSRKVMIVPPATSAQINEAEGTELKTYTVTVDGTEITEDMNLEENEVKVTAYLGSSIYVTSGCDSKYKVYGVMQATGTVTELDLKTLVQSTVVDDDHIISGYISDMPLVIVGNYGYGLVRSGKTILIYKVDLVNGGVTLDKTYEPEITGNVYRVFVYCSDDDTFTFIFNTNNEADADVAKKLFVYDPSDKSITPSDGIIVSDAAVPLWCDNYGTGSTYSASNSAAIAGEIDGKEIIIVGKYIYSVDKTTRVGTIIFTSASYSTRLAYSYFNYNFIQDGDLYSLTSRTTGTNLSCKVTLSDETPEEVNLSAESRSENIPAQMFTFIDGKVVAVYNNSNNGLVILPYIIEIKPDNKINVKPYTITTLTEV